MGDAVSVARHLPTYLTLVPHLGWVAQATQVNFSFPHLCKPEPTSEPMTTESITTEPMSEPRTTELMTTESMATEPTTTEPMPLNP